MQVHLSSKISPSSHIYRINITINISWLPLRSHICRTCTWAHHLSLDGSMVKASHLSSESCRNRYSEVRISWTLIYYWDISKLQYFLNISRYLCMFLDKLRIQEKKWVFKIGIKLSSYCTKTGKRVHPVNVKIWLAGRTYWFSLLRRLTYLSRYSAEERKTRFWPRSSGGIRP